jgi:tRNA threonylcarbamoyladenosine biosynthesis protein TsaE
MIYRIDEVAALGAAIARRLRPGDAVGLSGPLGAGKTTLARAILAALGLEGEAPSPSFAIVQGYQPPEVTLPIWHVDLYRVENENEIDELGLDEARDGAVVVMEWPERLGTRGWSDMLLIAIASIDDQARRLTVTVPPAWEARWLPL